VPRRTDTSSILITAAALIGVIAASSCTDVASNGPPQTREAELSRITGKCGLPRSSLRLSPGGELHFQPDPNARYEAVDCVLRELRSSGLVPNVPFAFVGNEAPAPEANDAAPH
jgi:hypothetical protein